MSGRLIALRLPPDRLPAELRAVWEAGDAAAPLPMDAPEQRIRDLLDRCRPHELVAITPGGTEHERTPLDSPRPVPEDTALVVTTSGSTGDAKGVLLSHRAIDAATTASVRRLGARPGERFALALPLHHVAGVQVVLRAWACGTEAHVVPDPGDPLQLAAAPAEHISLVPTQLRRLVDLHERGDLDADALRRWRTILVGGAHLDTGLLDRARAAGATIVTSYGMTETCGGCVYDGLPLDDVEVALRHDRGSGSAVPCCSPATSIPAPSIPAPSMPATSMPGPRRWPTAGSRRAIWASSATGGWSCSAVTTTWPSREGRTSPCRR